MYCNGLVCRTYICVCANGMKSWERRRGQDSYRQGLTFHTFIEYEVFRSGRSHLLWQL